MATKFIFHKQQDTLTNVRDAGGDLVHPFCPSRLEHALHLRLVLLAEAAQEDPDVLQEEPRPLHPPDLKLVEQRPEWKFIRSQKIDQETPLKWP